MNSGLIVTLFLNIRFNCTPTHWRCTLQWHYQSVYFRSTCIVFCFVFILVIRFHHTARLALLVTCWLLEISVCIVQSVLDFSKRNEQWRTVHLFFYYDQNQDATSKTEQYIKHQPAQVTSLKCWMMLSPQINALLIRQNIISPVHHKLQGLNQWLKYFF